MKGKQEAAVGQKKAFVRTGKTEYILSRYDNDSSAIKMQMFKIVCLEMWMLIILSKLSKIFWIVLYKGFYNYVANMHFSNKLKQKKEKFHGGFVS